ncbi:MAG: alkaline phosphatase PhoX, partial [Woeseiaceae bacterium]
MLNRRRFIQSIAAAAAAPSLTQSCAAASMTRFGDLRPDADRIIDLPNGFSYRVVSRVGDVMSDGLRVPGAHDGMA